MIILCEDGSLKIFMTGLDITGYWLQPNVTSAGVVCVSKPAKKKQLLGTQNVSRVPSSLEILGHSTHITLLRPRWFEFCFKREESIHCQNKITVNFGATQGSGGVDMIDSIQVWTKTKEAFGWPEDTEEYSAANVANVALTNHND